MTDALLDNSPGPAQADMTRPQPERVTAGAHGGLCLRPLADYFFASRVMVTDIVAAELAQAAVSFPLAFAGGGDDLRLVALLSTVADQNLFVSATGTWLTDFVPASLCTYPFTYQAPEDGGPAALYVDRASGLLDPAEGAALFTEAGKPSDKMKEMVRILREYEKNRRLTRQICAALGRYGLLVPWGADCGVAALQGLLRVDEAALNRLPQGMFSALRQAGALPIAYAQLVSLALVPRLAGLARLHARAQEQRKQLLRSCFRQEDSILPDSFHF